MKTIGSIFSFVVGVILATIYNGYVLSVLWGWFIVPSFGFPTLSVGYAIGVASVVGYLTHQYQKQDETADSTDILLKMLLYFLLKPTFALIFGWIITLFL